MKRTYEKPVLTKARVTLQAVTALDKTSGRDNGGIIIGPPNTQL